MEQTVQRDVSMDSESEQGIQEDSNFVNIGLQNWIALRDQWKSGTKPKTTLNGNSKRGNRPIDADLLYEELFSSDKKDGSLSQKIPLPELISVLNEVWEADGLA